MLREEELQFSAASAGHALADDLRAALIAVRKWESTETFFVERSVELPLRFGGSFHTSGLYGTVWFKSWQLVAKRPDVNKALEAADGKTPLVFIMGSALGEQCIFAVSVGARCIGYELLCDSMVARAQNLTRRHAPLADFIEYRCTDAAKAEGLDHVAMAFLND